MNDPFYVIDGTPYPRTTLILGTISKGFALDHYKFINIINAARTEKWRDIVIGYQNIKDIIYDSEEHMRAACDHGSFIHDWLEQYALSGKELDITIDELDGFNNWLDKYDPEIVCPELEIHSVKLGYAGTVDCPCIINNELCVVDYKTSRKLQNTYELQLSFYTMAIEEMLENDHPKVSVLKKKLDSLSLPYKVKKIYGLKLGGNKKNYYFKRYAVRKSVVKSLMNVWKWNNPTFIDKAKKRISQK